MKRWFLLVKEWFDTYEHEVDFLRRMRKE